MKHSAKSSLVVEKTLALHKDTPPLVSNFGNLLWYLASDPNQVVYELDNAKFIVFPPQTDASGNQTCQYQFTANAYSKGWTADPNVVNSGIYLYIELNISSTPIPAPWNVWNMDPIYISCSDQGTPITRSLPNIPANIFSQLATATIGQTPGDGNLTQC